MAAYVCDCCHGTFESGWSDQEARQEADRDFPYEDISDMALVCDDCDKKIMAFHNHPRLKDN